MSNRQELKIKNKYTGELIDTIPADNAETLQTKIKTIARNQEELRELDFHERAKILSKFATRIRFKKKDLKKLIVAEGGLPIKYSEWEIAIVSNGFKFCEWYYQFIEEKTLTSIEGEDFVKIRHIPQGIAACVSPRNTPLSLPLYQLGANYLVGNPALVKPSTACPLTMLKAYSMMEDMDIPALGALNLVIAPGQWAVNEFIKSDLIKVFLSISSSHTAKDILVRYAKELKKRVDKSMGIPMYNMPFKQFVFECAGNDAGIIMDDVNLEQVAKWNAMASYTNSGQQCFSMKRIIVHKDIYDDYIELLIKEIEKMKYGDPTDPQTDIGPLGSRKILMMMEVMVADAKKYDAKIYTGGDKIDTGEDYGLFYLPTLVEIKPELCEDLSKAPFLWREEAFGPVRSVTKADDMDDAIRLANASNYGMRAVVYSSDLDQIEIFKKRLEAANIYVNAKPMLTDITVALGGIKDSAYPAGAKYYPQELVFQKYINDQTPVNLDKIK
ncbi:MAG: aldehyde dehydrogenase family protein [Candidatus Lokiarchaeota archaeon]|nr:aldehyde dehydrogenase family protein [Candidatus Lokiarchaeota archaeon]MBD3198762.1 aldehyde dehydrogenase family protein [Candidatus Lokiarchaeota archaeon]